MRAMRLRPKAKVNVDGSGLRLRARGDGCVGEGGVESEGDDRDRE